ALWRLLGWGLPLATVAGALLAALSVGATSRALARVGLLTGADGPARVRGVYFSLITQAFVLVAFLWVRNQQAYTGGVNGINNLAKLRLAGHTFARPGQLYVLIAAALFLCYLGCAGLVRTKFGKVLTAIRDTENRVLALGYNTAAYKAAAFTLAGALAGLAGALFVPANGSTGPGHMDVVFSINAVV